MSSYTASLPPQRHDVLLIRGRCAAQMCVAVMRSMPQNPDFWVTLAACWLALGTIGSLLLRWLPQRRGLVFGRSSAVSAAETLPLSSAVSAAETQPLSGSAA